MDEFLAHVRSFLAVFPNVRIIAGRRRLRVLHDRLGRVRGPRRRRALIDVLERPGVLDDVNGAPDSNNRTPQAWADTLLGLTWARGDELREAVGDGPLITDDRPLPEYFILRRLADPDAPA